MITTIDKAGRVVIPAEVRKRLGLTAGMELEMVVDGFAVGRAEGTFFDTSVLSPFHLVAAPRHPRAGQRRAGRRDRKLRIGG